MSARPLGADRRPSWICARRADLQQAPRDAPDAGERAACPSRLPHAALRRRQAGHPH